MFKKLLALVALAQMIATPVYAQKWTDGVGPQPVNYPLITSSASPPEQLGDGSDAHGGTAPAQTLVAPIPSNFDISKWMNPDCKTAGTTSCSRPVADPLTEAKFRTHCTAAKAGYFDFILYPGQANVGHAHLFFGNTDVTKDSTFETLRTRGSSTCGGGPINRSAYWIPCLMLGPNKCLKPDYQVVYYNVSTKDHDKLVPFPPGFSMLGGANPADMNNDYAKSLVTASNARGGVRGMKWSNNGVVGWKCESGGGRTADSPAPGDWQPSLKTIDGKRTLKCNGNDRYIQSIHFPTCWDGRNLTSPDGRRHVAYAVVDSANGGASYCPIGWRRIPTFEQTTYYTLVDSDFEGDNLYLSSDRMSSDPTKWFAPGSTAHSDWFGAWDYDVMTTWMIHCNGISMNGQPGDPRDCSDTSFGDGRAGRMNQPAPDGGTGAKPTVNLSRRYGPEMGAYRYFPVTPPRGPATLHTHAH